MKPGMLVTRRFHGKPCPYCERPMSVDDAARFPTRDHTVPASKGGTRTIRACWTCNMVKKDMMPDAWQAFMSRNPRWWETHGPRPHRRAFVQIRRAKAAQAGAGKGLTGPAKKALIRSVTEPVRPHATNGAVLIYSTETSFEPDESAGAET